MGITFATPLKPQKKKNMNNHPAKKLGAWLQAKRKAAGFVVSEIAGLLRLGPAKYTEIECGIGKWLNSDKIKHLAGLLSLNEVEIKTFDSLFHSCEKSTPLTFANVYSRDQLKPVRLRHFNKKKITESERAKILDAVFKETV